MGLRVNVKTKATIVLGACVIAGSIWSGVEAYKTVNAHTSPSEISKMELAQATAQAAKKAEDAKQASLTAALRNPFSASCNDLIIAIPYVYKDIQNTTFPASYASAETLLLHLYELKGCKGLVRSDDGK